MRNPPPQPCALRSSEDYAAYLASLVQKANVTPQDSAIPFGWTTANGIELLVGGEKFYPRIADVIEAAQHSVHIIQFGYRPGETGHRFATLLGEKAHSGINVRLIVDYVGSALYRRLARQMYGGMAERGLEVLVNNPFALYRRLGALRGRGSHRINWTVGGLDHRKLFVIDGSIGFVGGAGIEDHFANGAYHDAYICCNGEIVHDLQLIFLASFVQLGGILPATAEALRLFFPSVPRGLERVPIHAMQNVPAAGFRPINEVVFAELAQAQRTLDIICPYITDQAAVDSLIAAARRGVRVRLIVPGKPDRITAACALRHHYRRMSDAGIEIWEFPAVAHAKVIVRDGETVLIGSLNLDALSLRHSRELQLRIDDVALAAKVTRRIFDRDVALSVRATSATGRMTRAWDSLMALMSPLW